MASYYIPSNKIKGEGRILYIFTGRSLIATAIGFLIGLVFYFIFSLIGLKNVGIVLMVLFAVIGYCIVTIKIPANGNTKLEKNVGGETLFQIIIEYIKFKKGKKIYSYAIDRKEPDYLDDNIQTRIETLTESSPKDIKKVITKEVNK